ncbi:MAG: hypothetical protein GWN18_03275, partial [Thermoplasmata archaeon]|nr:hypothetical protein [Thermoplasmata archaeon]
MFSTVSTSIDKGTLLTGGPPTVNVLGRGMFQTVNDAIDAARDGDVILVGAGVYKDDVCIDKSVTL